MKIIEDRVGQFLVGHTDNYLFDELSIEFLEKNGFDKILKGIPVPVKKKDMVDLSLKKIAESMAFIIGCDINFKHRDSYVEFIIKNYSKDFAKYLMGEGVEGAAKNDYDFACILFRAAILIDPDNVDALYCYGRACKDMYETGGSEDFVGALKAEALEAFEKVTIKRPDFDMAHYFLAYAYMNLGMYLKAKLTFEDFTKITKEAELKKEALQWIEKLEEPVKIEAAYTLVVSGHFEEGIEALIPYSEDERYSNWWPLWQYLGVAYKSLGNLEMAEGSFLKVLQLSPSNLDTMEELVEVYNAMRNEEKVQKYKHKIEIVKENIEKDRNIMPVSEEKEKLS